jgi:hypothetical protein
MRFASRMPGVVLVLIGLTVPAVIGQTSAAIDKSYMGTWKLNLAKSKYQPAPGPKGSTRVHEDRGGGFVLVTTDSINAQGAKTHGAYVYKPDGKEYPVAGANQPGAATIALTAVDPWTVNFTQRLDGKVTGTGTRTVSKDGKTMTIVTKGTNAQGQPTSSDTLWEKQ